jgi:hypothetical protein
MNRLIDAFEGLITAAANSGGELAKTANFTLENVNWTGQRNKHEPLGHPTVDRHLEAACANSGPHGSSSHMVAQALLGAMDQINWRPSPTDYEGEPDMAAFSRNFTATRIVGEGGMLPSDKVKAGFSLQGPDTYYPPHAHHAEESYWIIGGDGDWKVGQERVMPCRPTSSPC